MVRVPRKKKNPVGKSIETRANAATSYTSQPPKRTRERKRNNEDPLPLFSLLLFSSGFKNLVKNRRWFSLFCFPQAPTSPFLRCSSALLYTFARAARHLVLLSITSTVSILRAKLTRPRLLVLALLAENTPSSICVLDLQSDHFKPLFPSRKEKNGVLDRKRRGKGESERERERELTLRSFHRKLYSFCALLTYASFSSLRPSRPRGKHARLITCVYNADKTRRMPKTPPSPINILFFPTNTCHLPITVRSLLNR